ncbi:MAG: hypothetical protein AB9860_01585 [Methanomassiliicoccales archaeon]
MVSPEEDFQPLEETPIDIDYQLEQLVRQFNTIKSGLPEAPKNSKDAYARNYITDKAERIIMIILEDGNDKHPSLLGILDFAGASISDFEGDPGQHYGGWKTWSSRTSSKSTVSKEIEGGFGNGGKAFMKGVSTVEASMHSSKNGRRTKMGFRPKSGFTPGYFMEKGVAIKNITDEDPIDSLDHALDNYSINKDDVLKYAPFLINRKNWTLVELVGIKDVNRHWSKSAIELVVTTLKESGQCVLTIETTNVFVIHNGKLVEGPLKHESLEPMDQFKDPFVNEIPEVLIDPITKEKIAFTRGNFLIVKTSKKMLNLNPQLKPLNTLRIRSGPNIVGYYKMSEIAPAGIYGRLFGELTCDCLTPDDYSGQLRMNLNFTPRTRALEEWVREKLDEIGQVVAESLSGNVSNRERMEVEKRLLSFRKAMAEFLEPEEVSKGPGSGGAKGGHEPKVKKEPESVDKVVLEGGVGFVSIPTGVTIPIQHEALDANGRVVPGCYFAWYCDPVTLEMDGGGNIKSAIPGRTSLWIKELDSGITSEALEVNVYEIKSVTLNPEKTTLMRGERSSLNVSAIAAGGESPQRLALEYEVLPKGTGEVGKLGFFTAGDEPGNVMIKARFGPGDNEAVAYIEISDEKKERKPTMYKGGGVPYIVLCGNEAPGCTDLPMAARTKPANPEEPTIIMYEPDWSKRNIIWINPESAESRRVKSRSRGNAPMSRINTKTYAEFLALKCFEILKLLRAQQLLGVDAQISPINMIESLARAEIEAAPFIDHAYKLVDGWDEIE